MIPKTTPHHEYFTWRNERNGLKFRYMKGKGDQFWMLSKVLKLLFSILFVLTHLLNLAQNIKYNIPPIRVHRSALVKMFSCFVCS